MPKRHRALSRRRKGQEVLRIPVEDKIQGLRTAWVEARGVRLAEASDGLRARCEIAAKKVLTDGLPGGEERRNAIRDLLRQGGFKPAGRSKPAQEYLLRTVQQTGFPMILNAVDINNLHSLESGLPISMIALDRVGDRMSLRWGREGETYIFNASGQSLDVSGLLCLCQGQGEQARPIANPVKDSMFAKLVPEDTRLLACLYSSIEVCSDDELRGYAEEMADSMLKWADASEATVMLCDALGGVL